VDNFQKNCLPEFQSCGKNMSVAIKGAAENFQGSVWVDGVTNHDGVTNQYANAKKRANFNCGHSKLCPAEFRTACRWPFAT
jgi:hypothetical protein